ncbi:MAG TPA: hypothetical protein GXX30_02345 [Firmicutes bacterium]|nr:hypothetical protein [Candidatus Fermentithermobacillaceae bacterium]
MLRWIGRLVSSTLKADKRWLLPILLSATFALASLVPVEALQHAGAAGFSRYCARALGADLRIEVNSLDSGGRAALKDLLDWATKKGARVGRVYETAAPMKFGTTEVPVRVVLLAPCTGNTEDDSDQSYPFYGGELWSVPPKEALARGVALSTNAVKSLGVREGDKVCLFGRTLEVTATFPETLLTMATSGIGGAAVVTADLVGISADMLPGAAEVVVVKMPDDLYKAFDIGRHLKEVLGKQGVLGSDEIAPAIQVGLTRLKQAFLWSGLVIVFMCAFGLAFGVEDYANSKGDELATLKILGFSPWLVGLVMVLRLIVVGLAAGLLAVGLGWLMTSATAQVAGTEARDVVDLIRPSVVPWDFFVIAPALVLVFGAFPLLVRLVEKPHQVLWSKMRGFPLATRTRAGMGSLLSTLVLSGPVTLGLVRWYLGSGEVPVVGATVVVIAGMLVLVAVGLLIWIVSTLGRAFPARFKWALTYLRVGRGRLVAATTAVAFALAVCCATVLMDKALTWEAQAAVRRQVPFNVCVLLPHGALNANEEEAISGDLSSLRGVEYSVYCDVGWAYIFDTRGSLIKAPKLEQAALFGSTLGEYASVSPPGSIPCTIWEESVRGPVIGKQYTLTLGPSKTSGPQGRPFNVVIVGLDPRPGLRVGLNAPLTVPEGTLDMPVYRFLGVRADPAYSFQVAQELKEMLPQQGELYDFGPVEVMLRSAAEELSFVWRAVAFFALLVSVVISFTTSSMSRLMRSYELALLRTLGIAGWRLAVGPYAEAIVQGLISGLAGVLIAYLLVYRGLTLFINVALSPAWTVSVGVVAVSLVISLVLQSMAFRADLRRSPVEVLRSE